MVIFHSYVNVYQRVPYSHPRTMIIGPSFINYIINYIPMFHAKKNVKTG